MLKSVRPSVRRVTVQTCKIRRRAAFSQRRPDYVLASPLLPGCELENALKDDS